MGNPVYANNMEVSCKASGGKSICSFPDVCFTPPLTPATPPGVPVPYPNTAFASDTSDGSSSVKISGQEVMLKNKSYFKQSTGDEAGSAPKKNVVTSKIKGKAYFIVWSMDVKVEGENVVRHMDLTTHNHASPPVGAPPALHTALMAMGRVPGCKTNKEAVEKKCSPWQTKAKCPDKTEAEIVKAEADRQTAATTGTGRKSQAYRDLNKKVRELYTKYAMEVEKNECRRCLRCVLLPYDSIDKVRCKKQTGDHLIENATINELPGYDIGAAPTAFVEGPSYHIGTHGLEHSGRTMAARKRPAAKKLTVRESAELAAAQHCATFPNAQCDPGCIAEQLVNAHDDMGIDETDPVKRPRLHSHHTEEMKPFWDQFNAALKKDLGL